MTLNRVLLLFLFSWAASNARKSKNVYRRLAGLTGLAPTEFVFNEDPFRFFFQLGGFGFPLGGEVVLSPDENGLEVSEVLSSILNLDKESGIEPKAAPFSSHMMLETQLEMKPKPEALMKPGPQLNMKPEPEMKPKPEPEMKPKPEPEMKPKPEAQMKPKPEPEMKPKPEAQMKPKPEPEMKPKPEAQMKPKPEPEMKPKPEAQMKPKPEPEMKPKPEAQMEPKPEPEMKPKPEAQVKPKPTPESGSFSIFGMTPRLEPEMKPKPEPGLLSLFEIFLPELKPESGMKPKPEPGLEMKPKPEPGFFSFFEMKPKPEPNMKPKPEHGLEMKPKPEPGFFSFFEMKPKPEPNMKPKPEPGSEMKPKPEPGFFSFLEMKPKPDSNAALNLEPESDTDLDSEAEFIMESFGSESLFSNFISLLFFGDEDSNELSGGFNNQLNSPFSSMPRASEFFDFPSDSSSSGIVQSSQNGAAPEVVTYIALMSDEQELLRSEMSLLSTPVSRHYAETALDTLAEARSQCFEDVLSYCSGFQELQTNSENFISFSRALSSRRSRRADDREHEHHWGHKHGNDDEHEHGHHGHEHGRWENENEHDDHDHNHRWSHHDERAGSCGDQVTYDQFDFGVPLGWGSTSDSCLYSNWHMLSKPCQQAVMKVQRVRSDYVRDLYAEEAGMGCMLLPLFLVNLVLILMIAKYKYGNRAKEVRALLSALHANADLKAQIEAITGTVVPAPCVKCSYSKAICSVITFLLRLFLSLVAAALFVHVAAAITVAIVESNMVVDAGTGVVTAPSISFVLFVMLSVMTIMGMSVVVLARLVGRFSRQSDSVSITHGSDGAAGLGQRFVATPTAPPASFISIVPYVYNGMFRPKPTQTDGYVALSGDDGYVALTGEEMPHKAKDNKPISAVFTSPIAMI